MVTSPRIGQRTPASTTDRVSPSHTIHPADRLPIDRWSGVAAARASAVRPDFDEFRFSGDTPAMEFRLVRFGVVEIDGDRYDHDVVIDAGQVRRRRKGPSKPLKSRYGHTPLTPEEAIPWSLPRLIVGTGANGQLPITDDFYREAARRGVEVIAKPTAEACELISATDPASLAAVLHVTC